MAKITGEFIKRAYPDDYLIRSAYHGFFRAPLGELSRSLDLITIMAYCAANFNIYKFNPFLYEKIVNEKPLSESEIPELFYKILYGFNSAKIHNINNTNKPYKNVFQWIHRVKKRGSSNYDTQFKDNPRYYNNVNKFPVFRLNQRDLELDKKINKTIGKKNLRERINSAEIKELERIIADLSKNNKYNDFSPDKIYREFASMLNDYGACTLL